MKKIRFNSNLINKIKNLNPGLYFRELSVVIIGVAITFFFSDLINNIKEKKDLKVQLNMIYNELENNIKMLDEVIDYYEQYSKLRNYLRLYAQYPEQIYADSIQLYTKYAFSGMSFNYQKAAYELFINSGIMKTMADRQLLLYITESYFILEDFKIENDKHLDLKLNEYSKFYSTVDKKMIGNDSFDITDPRLSSVFNFHAINSGLEHVAQRVKNQIENILIENKESFLYNNN